MNQCRIEGCERPVHVQVRGLCKAHYDQGRRSGAVPRRPEHPDVCGVEECDRPFYGQGMCEKHYRRFRRRGETELRSVKSRFDRFAPLQPEDECWPWGGPSMGNGYGAIKVDSNNKLAHRVSYEIFVGPIPEGMQIDHLCRNRNCVNPKHLEAVSQRENVLRGEGPAGLYARRTECHICGGELTFYPNRGKYGVRVCKACQRRRSADAKRAYFEKVNAAP